MGNHNQHHDVVERADEVKGESFMDSRIVITSKTRTEMFGNDTRYNLQLELLATKLIRPEDFVKSPRDYLNRVSAK